MSTTPSPLPQAQVPRPSSGSGASAWLGCGLALSIVINFAAGVLILMLCMGLIFRSSMDSDLSGSNLTEKYHSGSKTASDKVAIIALEGAIMEGLLGHAHKQLEQVGKDDSYKAVVLRINSPGGSITASDDLYRRIVALRDGDEEQKIKARPVVVSMGAIAASGGYYIAAPAKEIFAERTTITGSIGVYASFPNVKELADKYGVVMNTLRAGAVKDAGSMFRNLDPTEQAMFQDMVDEAYLEFLGIVEKGRPKLTRAKLLERFEVKPLRPDPKNVPKDKEGKPLPAQPYTRYLADGGIFSGPRAQELGLVDAIGPLEKAVSAAASAAGLNTYRAVKFQKQLSFSDLLSNVQSDTRPAGFSALDPKHLRSMLTPRLWYLAPGHEAEALLTGTGN